MSEIEVRRKKERREPGLREGGGTDGTKGEGNSSGENCLREGAFSRGGSHRTEPEIGALDARGSAICKVIASVAGGG